MILWCETEHVLMVISVEVTAVNVTAGKCMAGQTHHIISTRAEVDWDTCPRVSSLGMRLKLDPLTA